MKRVVWFVMATTASWILITGCKKNLPEPVDYTIGMEELKVSPYFSWKTNRDAEFVITAGFSSVVRITSEDGAQLLHQGFCNRPDEGYHVTLSIPSFVERVLVNGQSVTVTENPIHVTLSGSSDFVGDAALGGTFRQVPLDGLLAAWHFNENTGSVAHDEMGLHDGTITGAAWVDGISGSALKFDGSGGNVMIPNGGAFNPVGDKISFSVWFKLNEVGQGGAFIYHNVKYLVKIDNQGRPSFALYTPVWHSIVIPWGNRILDTDWHHVAATYDGIQMKLYVDGTLMATGDVTGNLQSSVHNILIGTQNTINYFNGILDEMMVYDKALSVSEIQQIVTGTPNPGNGSGSLISSWNLNENSGSVAHDGTDGNNGTITGAAWAPGVSGSCLRFDGATGNVNVPNASNLNPVNQLTMMAWAKTQENKTVKVFQKGDWDGHGIGQGKWDGWNVHIRMSDNTSKSLHWGSGLPILNQWYHIALTYDGMTLKMYVNGQLQTSMGVSGPLKVNTRTLSIGSDNGAQKFFNGDIDECLMFGKALSQTEIQANFTEQGTAPDQDGDGVPDGDDAYPSDPARAFVNYFPSTGFGTLAFEDLWPAKGDYDFNDLVMDYRYTSVTNGNNKVTEIFGYFVVRAIGAGLHNGFGFQLPGTSISPSDITVAGSDLQEGYITLNTNGTEANQDKITIIVFDDAYNILQSPGGFGVNVTPGAPYVDPDTLVITLGFTPNMYTLNDIGLFNFNPFLIVNLERGKEIHLPDYPPTSLVNPAYFRTAQDDTDPVTGKYYKTTTNLPWAINISESYDYTVESRQITAAYLKFAAWAESSGAIYPDWYSDVSGYRNTANIYTMP